MQLAALNHWGGWVALILFTLVLANTIAICLDSARSKRIAEKAAQLSRSGGRQIPVTVVTGFLGAGKTVLLNRLLGESALRICVIENEKGAVSIDHALLERRTSAGVIVLKNGCLCCTADGAGESELERVLDRLAELSSAGGDAAVVAGFSAVQYVIIETSGLADPGPILQTFFRRDMQARFCLDGVIAVVDAKHVSHHLTQGGFLSRSSEAGRQVGFADVVLLNKVDIASAAELQSARAAVAAANPTARVIECVRCAVDPAVLLSRRYFDVSRTNSGLFAPARLDDNVPRGIDASAAAHGHVHVEGVTAITIETGDTSYNVRALQEWLQDFISEHWRQVYRVKGLVWVCVPAEEGVINSDRAGASGTAGKGVDGGCSPPASPGEACSSDDESPHLLRLFIVQGVHAEVHGVVLSANESRRVAERGGEEDGGAAFRGDPDAGAATGTAARRLRAGIVVIGTRFDAARVQASFAAACGPTGRLSRDARSTA